jgi:RNA-directed DNA polymerase
MCRLPDDEIDFLGYTSGSGVFSQDRAPYIATRPSRKSIKRMSEAMRIQTDRNMEWMDGEATESRLSRTDSLEGTVRSFLP